MGTFIWIIFTIFMIFVAVIYFTGFVLHIKDEIKIKIQKKKEKVLQKVKLEEAKKKRNNEIQKNSSIDLSTLAFPRQFKEEFGQDFFEFKESLKIIRSSDMPKGNYYGFGEIKNVFMFNDKYFYLYSTLTKDNDKENNSYLLMGDDEKTDDLINLYTNTKLSDFKKNLYSLDDLLYVVGYTDKEESRYQSFSQPSKISLAFTEGLYGTAAAMKKLNDSQNKDMVVTKNYYIYKFIFSEKTNLPVMFDSSWMSPSYEILKLYNTKTYERYQEKLFNKANKTLEKKDDELNFEKLMKYKELLDCGVITQEEFDKKKKELL